MFSATKLVICMSILAAVIMEETGAMPHGHLEKSVPLYLDSVAPSAPTQSVRPLSNHSISPWTSNITYEMDRVPHFITEARCSLQGCLNSHGIEDRSLKSEPIWFQTLFLRRVKNPTDKKYHYRLESKLITVGCTCVRPSIVYQQ
ncbi:interleukin 17a/f1 [Gadus morhua]|uniref:Interleukin 17a/f1 n=1 Tax=Gadus morhua TaxID=8049 RepID=A0A8C4ZMU2_GADMO|nr:interleukin-17F-like [Gadus morhua]